MFIFPVFCCCCFCRTPYQLIFFLSFNAVDFMIIGNHVRLKSNPYLKHSESDQKNVDGSPNVVVKNLRNRAEKPKET